MRGNEVHGNVTGIEIENSVNALVEGNDAHDNTGGILVFLLPNNPSKVGSDTRVLRNRVVANNHRELRRPQRHREPGARGHRHLHHGRRPHGGRGERDPGQRLGRDRGGEPGPGLSEGRDLRRGADAGGELDPRQPAWARTGATPPPRSRPWAARASTSSGTAAAGTTRSRSRERRPSRCGCRVAPGPRSRPAPGRGSSRPWPPSWADRRLSWATPPNARPARPPPGAGAVALGSSPRHRGRARARRACPSSPGGSSRCSPPRSPGSSPSRARRLRRAPGGHGRRPARRHARQEGARRLRRPDRLAGPRRLLHVARHDQDRPRPPHRATCSSAPSAVAPSASATPSSATEGVLASFIPSTGARCGGHPLPDRAEPRAQAYGSRAGPDRRAGSAPS